MATKTGKPPTGQRSSRRRIVKSPVEPYENPLPEPPLAVAKAAAQRPLARANHSPLTVAFRHITGGWRRYITYVDLAARKGSESMTRYRDCYQALRALDKTNHWPEQICEMANVSPAELVGEVCRAIWENKAAESSMVSAIAHPEMLMSTIKFARKEENFRDRELYFTMTGSLPHRKGNSINIFNQAAGMTASAPELGPGPPRMRSFDDEVVEMSRDLEAPDAPFVVKDVPSQDR